MNPQLHEESCRQQPGTSGNCLKGVSTNAVAPQPDLFAHEVVPVHAHLLIGRIYELKAELEAIRKRIEKDEETRRSDMAKITDLENGINLLNDAMSALQKDTETFQRRATKKNVSAMKGGAFCEKHASRFIATVFPILQRYCTL